MAAAPLPLTLPIHDPVLIVAIAMASFLIMPLITDRLRIPGIIGILIAGVLVGPHGIGLLERDETIQLLGTVGLLYLVFLAGLEVDLADLSRKRGRAITFGFLTFIVPQVIGTVAGLWLFDMSMATAILMGSVFSSHSFLALLIAKRLGLTDRELPIAVIGGTVITDTLALLVLAGVSQATSGEFGFGFLVKLLLQAGIFSGVVVFGLPILGRWFFRNISDGGAQFAFMMTVLFTCGFVAHMAGLEPIIGAFLAGLAMNRLVPHHGVLANRAFFIGNSIFVPFFLLSVGMLIDLRMVVSDVRTIEMAAFMTAAVIIGKGIAAWGMRAIFGYSRNEIVVAWGLSLPQAATTLAVVLVGHRLELFDDAILNATVVMVLITCVLGPMMVEMAGRKLVAQITELPEEESATPETSFQRILIPLANPQSSENLLDLAMALRRPMNDEPLLPLSVASRESDVATSEKLLSSSVMYLAAAEVAVKPVIRVDPNPVNGILRAKSELRATSLVIGWSGPEASLQRHFHLNRGVIDDLIDETVGQLFIVRLSEPLSVIEHVVLVLPPLALAEHGFLELFADIKLLAKRTGAPLAIVAEHELTDAQQRSLRNHGSTIPLEFVAGNDVVAEVSQRSAKHTLVVLAGSREGTVSWSSVWNRQITQIAHGQRSCAVAFPRLAARVATGTFTGRIVKQVTGQSALLSQAHCRVQQQPTSVNEAIRAALPASLANSSAVVDRLIDGLSALTADVALVHGPAEGVLRPELIFVTFADVVSHEGLDVRLLIVLVNPVGLPPDRHLAHLSEMAQVITNRERLEALLAADSEGQAREVLNGASNS